MTTNCIEPDPFHPRMITKVQMLTNQGEYIINMPVGRIMHVGFGVSGIGVVYLWVEHSKPAYEWQDRTFYAIGDGDTVPNDLQYVGTAHDQSFSRTWHIYERV